MRLKGLAGHNGKIRIELDNIGPTNVLVEFVVAFLPTDLFFPCSTSFLDLEFFLANTLVPAPW